MTDLAHPAADAGQDTEGMAEAMIRQWLQDALELDQRYSDLLRDLDPEDDGALITYGLSRTGRNLSPDDAVRIMYLIRSLAHVLSRSGAPAGPGQPGAPLVLGKLGDFILGAVELAVVASYKPASGGDRTDPDDPDDGGEPV